MDGNADLYWALGFVMTLMGSLLGMIWRHTTNEKRHVSNGMSRFEIAAELKAIAVKVDSVANVIEGFDERNTREHQEIKEMVRSTNGRAG